MTVRRLISDELSARVEPHLLDRSPQRGGRWADHRGVIEAIAVDLPHGVHRGGTYLMSSGSWKGGHPAPAGPPVQDRHRLKRQLRDEPPLRLFLGNYRHAIAETVNGQRLRTWGQWHDLAESAALRAEGFAS